MSNIYKNAIDIYKQDAEHYRLKYIDALHTISLRDEEIEKLNNECWCGCNDDLRAEYMELQAENKTLQNKIEGLKSSDDVRKLRISRLKNDKLKAENVRLKNGFGHGVLVELEQVDSLKDEIKELKAEVDKEKEFAIETSIKNDRLMDQVSSNSSNSSSTHTHTISREIDDYMHHNPTCKGVRLFILPRDEFDEDDEYNGGCIYWDDGIE